MPFTTVNGMDMYYETHGEGPALAFAHGVGGNHAVWYQQVPFFSKSYKVITMDQRGFGHSEDANGRGRGSFVDDLRELLDQLGVGKVSLVAQSMGGSTCMGFTVRYPERVSALVMGDTLTGITLPDELREKQRANGEATRDLSQLERVVSKTLPLRDPAKAELYLQIASFNKNNENRFNQPAGSVQAQPITMEGVIAAARTVPMLFLVGEDDVLSRAEFTRAAASIVPNAQLAVIPNSGHSPAFEVPDVYNFAVASFLEQVLPRE
jgi:pimeloyl-ACP methyl ester carboxylesterase